MVKKQQMVAKVNFELISSEETASKVYYFNTTISDLKIGQNVWVISRGQEMVATFLGYDKETTYKPTSKIVRRLIHGEVVLFKQMREQILIKHPLNITDEALEQYCTLFKGNKGASKEIACAKLTRNVLMALSKYIDVNNDNIFIFKYGTQLIHVKKHTVVKLDLASRAKNFNKDWNQYMYLNEQLGIQMTDAEKEKYGLV